MEEPGHLVRQFLDGMIGHGGRLREYFIGCDKRFGVSTASCRSGVRLQCNVGSAMSIKQVGLSIERDCSLLPFFSYFLFIILIPSLRSFYAVFFDIRALSTPNTFAISNI